MSGGIIRLYHSVEEMPRAALIGRSAVLEHPTHNGGSGLDLR